jgi:hypothetical protein
MIEKSWKVAGYLSLALALVFFTPKPAAAQGTENCDDQSRANFAEMVASGASEEELEARFGHCREAGDVSGEETLKKLSPSIDKYQTVFNFNTSYERLNSCGYHPQAEMIACDVEIRQYGGYGGSPWGSFEYVRFCLDWDINDTWDFSTLGFVHVTDNIAPRPTPGWYQLAYATTFAAPAVCTNNDGRQMRARAILSWALPPPDCNFRPYWGNIIDSTVRRDP